MAGAVTLAARNAFSTQSVSTRVTTESPVVRWILTGIALLFLGVFIFMPLGVVFFEALRKGCGAYWDGLTQPDALAAIKLTLIAAGIAVPLNAVFGIAAAWAIGK